MDADSDLGMMTNCLMTELPVVQFQLYFLYFPMNQLKEILFFKPNRSYCTCGDFKIWTQTDLVGPRQAGLPIKVEHLALALGWWVRQLSCKLNQARGSQLGCLPLPYIYSQGQYCTTVCAIFFWVPSRENDFLRFCRRYWAKFFYTSRAHIDLYWHQILAL